MDGCVHQPKADVTGLALFGAHNGSPARRRFIPPELLFPKGIKAPHDASSLMWMPGLGPQSDSFEELARPLFDEPYNFAQWLTQHRDEAEELVQET